ncbi:MAG: glutathione S-transferase family protein [Pseudomonadales bacterium]|nr:glutathione S-transferase family protein [Pseudomonadales bacterium]
MSTLLLWSGVLSPFSAKVRIVLAEKGMQVEIREIPWSRATLWGPKPEDFLRASPRGEVPTLVDGELAIFDSTVICEYLEDAYPALPLMPESPADRARCRMWEDRADGVMANQLTVLIRELFLKPDGVGPDGSQRDLDAVTQAMTRFGEFHRELDGVLEKADCLCGSYSVADIATYVCLAFGQTLGAGFDGYPRLLDWFGRIQARPVVKGEFENILAAAAAA